MKTHSPVANKTHPRPRSVARVARKAASPEQRANADVVRGILGNAGVQPQLALSTPGDRFEREADHVADRVAVGHPAPLISRLASDGAASRATKEEPEEKLVQRKGVKKPDDEKQLQRKAVSEDDTAILQMKAAPDTREKEEGKNPVQRAEGGAASAAPNLKDLATRAVATKGAGRPLAAPTRAQLEPNMGVDLSSVRVHDDASAKSAAQSLNARAFTHGNDIWLGPGESQNDIRLMAHEATHVVQQQSGLAQRLVQRAAAAGGAKGGEVFDVKLFQLPPIKSRHEVVYRGWAAAKGGSKLQRDHKYDRGDPDQRSIWLSEKVKPPPEKILKDLGIDPKSPKPTRFEIDGKTVSLGRSEAARKQALKIPTWDRDGNKKEFEVDHIVELQVAGWPNLSTSGNELENMELLDQRSNSSAGGATRGAIRDSVKAQLASEKSEKSKKPVTPEEISPAEVTKVIKDKDVVFHGVVGGDRGNVKEGDSRWWTRKDIEEGEHFKGAKTLHTDGKAGSTKSFALVSTEGSVLGEYSLDGLPLIDTPAQKSRVGGLLIEEIKLNKKYTDETYTDEKKGVKIGKVSAEWKLPEGVKPKKKEFTVDLHWYSEFAGYLGDLPGFGADAKGASPVEFSPPEIEGDRVVAAGKLRPTVPLLGKQPISLRLVGSDIELAYAFEGDELSLPIPGLTIYDTSLVLFFGTRGLGVEGEIYFGIESLGSGRLGARISSERGFEADGQFLFDTELFDQASIEVWYRDHNFGARGTLAINRPDKIRGIRSAQITAAYEAGAFSAQGRVAPSIPGVQEAGLSVLYSEAEGLTICGNLQLTKDIPGIHSGSVDVTVRKREAGWNVVATGTAQPAIPGIDSQLKVNYDNGAFNAEFRGAFHRGMLAGNVNVGVTNRTLDAAGEPTGDPIQNGPLIVFGDGSATLQIAPWLQGTAGVRFAPNGEMTVSGEIGLSNQVEIFSRKAIDKSLLNIAVQVPIIPGVVAEVGGGLSAQAGIGPGAIDQLRVGITYNPAHEENTHVTGDGHLNIPADAGIRLAVRAGIGLGVPLASATGGLEIGGKLGITGAAEAGVHIDWTPAAGLKIDTVGELHGEPKFTFDVAGYVSVRGLGASLYENKWALAAYEFGSNMRFGARFPIHYVEGQPFNISLDDVEFTVPDINPRELLTDLIRQIA